MKRGIAGLPGLAAGSVLLAIVGAGAAAARVTRYECTFAQERAAGGGWIPEIVVVMDDSEAENPTVFDPVIRHFMGNPIAAQRGEETKARVTFNWRFTAPNKGQAAVMDYRLTYYKDGKPAKMLAQPGGYDNKYTGQGTCKVTTRG
jgi:hypothetical protein